MKKLQRILNSLNVNAVLLGIVGAGVAILALCLAILGAIVGWPVGIAMLYPLIQPYQDQLWFQISGTGFCVAAALFMFWLRNSSRHAYAVIELVCAINLIWFGVSHQKTSEIFGATLLAGIYVAVRGLDNWKQAVREESREQVTCRSSRSHWDAIQAEIQRLIEQNKDRENNPEESELPQWGPTTDLAVERFEVRFTESGPEYVVCGTVDMPKYIRPPGYLTEITS